MALWVPFRELWGSPESVRVDGVWEQKRKACLFRSDQEIGYDYLEDEAGIELAPVKPGRGFAA